MTAPPSDPSLTIDRRGLIAALEPRLVEACDGRLGPITWFKADWQRGGAATGNSTYREDDGTERPVVLKVPVVPRELRWTRRLQTPADDDLVVPRLYASGETLGGYDLAWIVMERFAHGPLGTRWNDRHIERIADAIARFHAIARKHAIDEPPRREDWDALTAEALASVRRNPIPNAPRWSDMLKRFRHRLDPIVAEWRGRDVADWLHGDLHLANAMSRESLDRGAVSLIDLAEVHAGHWLEDAVYLERQLWARPERQKRTKAVRAVAAARRARDLPVEADYARLAMIRRLMLAATAPCFLRSEGHPRHLAACLRWVETALGDLV